MKKLWIGFVVTANIAIGLVDLPAEAAGARRKISFEELSKYLTRESDGVVQQNPALVQACKSKNSACANFESKKKPWGSHWDSEKATEDAFLQTLFQTDEDRFLTVNGAPTFAEAKESAYSKMGFNQSKNSYSLPFDNVRGWGSLIHPPIFSLSKSLGYYMPGLDPIDPTQVQHPYYTEDFQRKVDQVSQTELTAGNRVSYLGGGPISFNAKLSLIKNAKRSLWVQVMVFNCDAYSSQLMEAMAERRRAGVDVRLMIEGLYARVVFRGCVQKFRDRDIDVVLVDDSTRLKTIARVAHPKIWIRDGEEAIMGGVNIMESEHIGDGFVEGYRDSDLRVESGPIVTDLMKQYVEIWKKDETKKNRSIQPYVAEIEARLLSERAAGVRGEGVYANILPDPVRRNQGVCRVAVQRDANRVEPIGPTLALYASQVSSRFLATTPKLKMRKKFKMKPNSLDAFWVELQKASNQRNVRIDLITNGIDGMAGDLTKFARNWANNAREEGQDFFERASRALANALAIMDSKGNQKAAQRMYGLGKGFHGWNYLRYGHQKIQIYDRILTSLGSFNLDGQSAFGNQEAQMFCLDSQLTAQTEAALTRDFTNGTPIHKD
ncbi:MAG: hypothetical protein JNL01_11740 [Bdellovibrionales bacterium]|nr:hypothetical protein [Bdellovibrionales bacterium]